MPEETNALMYDTRLLIYSYGSPYVQSAPLVIKIWSATVRTTVSFVIRPIRYAKQKYCSFRSGWLPDSNHLQTMCL